MTSTIIKCHLFLLFLFLPGYQSLAQSLGKAYAQQIERADSLYKKRDYKKAALTYSAAFQENGGLAYLPDRYMAACAWSLAGEADSAFYHLFRIIDRTKYDDLNKVLSESAFESLRDDLRWRKAIELITENKQIKEAKYNYQLIAILDTIYFNDQKYRLVVGDTISKYGMNSPQVSKMNDLILKSDSVNYQLVTGILDKYGWPGPEVIGPHGNTIFLVIQHSDLATQQKYLPVMRDAVKRGAAENSSLALLEDRIALGEGRCQIYGSQIGFDEKTNSYYVLPLSDPDHVDERREAMGLDILKEYAANWKINWNKDHYRKQMQKLLGKKTLKKYDCFNK